jgi:SAM-dependent methyltransferase
MKYHDFFINHISHDDVILDVGCGYGALSYNMAKKARRVVGIDINSEHINRAKTLMKPKENLSFLVWDATKGKIEIKPDVIVLSNVLEHINNRKEFLSVLITLCNRFLIRVPMFNRDWITLYKRERGLEWRLDSTHFTEYTLESFKDELSEVGLQVGNYSIQFGEIWAECEFSTRPNSTEEPKTNI